MHIALQARSTMTINGRTKALKQLPKMERQKNDYVKGNLKIKNR